MRIVYVAMHGNGKNDDEGAIAHALTELGHEVVKIHERDAAQHLDTTLASRADFVLSHHWDREDEISQVKLPLVFWCFDQITIPDDPNPGIIARGEHRINWVDNIMVPNIILGCLTDGDYVRQDKSGKLVQLMQGGDTRCMGRGKKVPITRPMMFMGTASMRTGRAQHIRELQKHYPHDFFILRPWMYRRALADMMASVAVIISPDSPATDLYWSNRVYMTLSLGGFLLHPYCEKLKEHYEFGKELVVYHNRKELIELIDHYVAHPEEREPFIEAGLARTYRDNTYTRRCAQLIDMVKERL